MKSLVIFDSVYGNTEKIALAVGEALGKPEDVRVVKVSEAKADQLAGVDLFVLGVPTQRFRTTAVVSEFLERIPANGLKGVKVAVFDTRLTTEEINKTSILAFFVKLFGRNAYAAWPMANRLTKKGGKLVGNPEGFCVKGMEGPLVEGEIDRAVNWARQVAAQAG